MELVSDKPISMDKLFGILVKVREESHIESLNCFQKNENLEGLSREALETKLLKSFNVNTEEVARMFGKAFDRVELVRLAHFAIEEANKLPVSDSSGKRKTEGDSNVSKKAKVSDTPAVSSHEGFSAFVL